MVDLGRYLFKILKGGYREMNFLKDVFEFLGKIDLKYNKDINGKQKLILNVKDKNNIGGELSADVDKDKSPVISVKLGASNNKDDKDVRVEWKD